MDIMHALILGVVEGISEFLPISSTGHLILTSKLLAIPQGDFVKSFEIIIQLGAILAIVVLYGRTLLRDIELLKRVIVAFIPTGILGFILYKLIKSYLLGNANVVLLSLFWGGVALISVEMFLARRKSPVASRGNNDKRRAKSELPTYRQSFLIGIAQSISMIPGVSRSAATIFGGLFVGLDRKQATEFSFMLAIPTMAAATGLDLVKERFAFTANEWLALAVGFITSFIIAIFAVKWLLAYVQKNNFIPFGIYRITLALLYLILIR